MNKQYIHREPLTSDIIFKAVFGRDTRESKALLIELLNLVLNRTHDPIRDLTYKNPFSLSDAVNEKNIVMDINVETEKGELIDIEMQIGELDLYTNRSVFYGCKQLTKGLERGDNYDKMKKSIVISFIKTTLFPQSQPMHSVFTLRERSTGAQLSDILELHYIELGKIDCSIREPEKMTPLEQIGAYIKCSGDPEAADFVEKLAQKGEKVVIMTDRILKKVSEEERLQYLRQSREKAEMQFRWEKQTARERGLAEGRAEGRAEQQLQIAKKLKSMNMPAEQISEATGLSIEEISNL